MIFKKIQKDSNDLEEFIAAHSRSGKKDDIFVDLTHLLAECGETADEIKGLEGKRAEDPSNYSKEELAKELVDVVFNLMKIANKYEIDLDLFWDKRLQRIREKFKS